MAYDQAHYPETVPVPMLHCGIRRCCYCLDHFELQADEKACSICSIAEVYSPMAGEIAAQNDRFRTLWNADAAIPGTIERSPSVAAEGLVFAQHIMLAVTQFDDFTAENNPSGRRDFGIVEVKGQRLCWKIETYDLDRMGHSPDPSDPEQTFRVMTIYRPEEH